MDNKMEKIINECERFIADVVEDICPEVKIEAKVKDGEDSTGYRVQLRGKVDDYATFETDYDFENIEQFKKIILIFVIQTFQTYYYVTKCGGFCKNAEICKYRSEE